MCHESTSYYNYTGYLMMTACSKLARIIISTTIDDRAIVYSSQNITHNYSHTTLLNTLTIKSSPAINTFYNSDLVDLIDLLSSTLRFCIVAYHVQRCAFISQDSRSLCRSASRIVYHHRIIT